MKFNFKIQDYQTAAVESVVKVFNGQLNNDSNRYLRDLGNARDGDYLYDFKDDEDIYGDFGFKNSKIILSDEQLRDNIREVQSENNIKLSDKLTKSIGRCSLDIEMETGERVIIVMGAINALKSRVSGALTKYNSCIA